MDRASRRSARPSPLVRASLAVPRSRRAAFSLVEVLVALTIVGILGALSLPKMNAVGNQNRVLRAAQGLQIEAQQAFAVAARNRAPVTLRWNSALSELQLTNLANTTIYRRRAITGYGLLASEVTVTPTVFTVYPTGLAQDSLIVSIQRSPYIKSVHVSRAGSVRIK
jgi:prepilin-type N-terminal cleavage/methylation domain-containing protein